MDGCRPLTVTKVEENKRATDPLLADDVVLRKPIIPLLEATVTPLGCHQREPS